MSLWEQEASRRWKSAWIGGSGPFACTVTYVKGSSVTLFKKASDAEAHKRRLDSLAPEKRRWRFVEVTDLKQVRAKRTAATPQGQR